MILFRDDKDGVTYQHIKHVTAMLKDRCETLDAALECLTFMVQNPITYRKWAKKELKRLKKERIKPVIL